MIKKKFEAIERNSKLMTAFPNYPLTDSECVEAVLEQSKKCDFPIFLFCLASYCGHCTRRHATWEKLCQQKTLEMLPFWIDFGILTNDERAGIFRCFREHGVEVEGFPTFLRIFKGRFVESFQPQITIHILSEETDEKTNKPLPFLHGAKVIHSTPSDTLSSQKNTRSVQVGRKANMIPYSSEDNNVAFFEEFRLIGTDKM